MNSKRLLIIFTLILSWRASVFGLSAEDMEGFPEGPVRQVVRIQYSEKGLEQGRTVWQFDEEKKPLEVEYGYPEYRLKAVFTWNLSGDVSRVHFYKDDTLRYRYEYRFDSAETETVRTITLHESDLGAVFWTYKNKGHLVEWSRYDANDRLLGRERYDWNPEGTFVEYRNLDSGNNLQRRMQTSYFSSDRIKESTGFTSTGEVRQHSRAEFNESGRMVFYEQSLLSEEENSRRICRFDENGNPEETTAYRNGNEINYREVYRCRDDGRKIECATLDAEGKTLSREEKVLDEQGHVIIRTVVMTLDPRPRKTESTYDGDNRLVQEVQWIEDHVQSRMNLEYDSRGRRVKASYTNNMEWSFPPEKGREETTETFYTYDSYGNMIESLTLCSAGDSKPPVLNANVIWQYTYGERPGNQDR